MANNKAFVRYANNKAVPGSLIVRKKAPSVGVWKEVDYDLCCDSVCPECPECIPCIQAETVYTVTSEDLADATGNTGITVNVMGNDITTANSLGHIAYYACGSSGTSTISTATSFSLCGTATSVFYFKDDQPVFIPGITTNLCTS